MVLWKHWRLGSQSVLFFTSRCSHCLQLAPTWETLAEIMTVVAENLLAEHSNHEHFTDEEYDHALKVVVPVQIAKVDCVVHGDLCRQQGIMAYPTLRLFVNGERWKAGDYRGDRTVLAMTDYLRQVEDSHKSELEKKGDPNVEIAHRGMYCLSRLACLKATATFV
jgi:thiol-disulfide isomerase/thioredoxin